ncbi:MAG: class I SAM-dependent methyltransferase [Microcoleaceae cyanobacterium]
MTYINGVDAKIEIISVHVPKTAGSTFKKVLLQVYGRKNVILDYPRPNKRRYQALESIHAQTKVIHGHFPANKYDEYYPDARQIIWLRNPIIALFSRYYFLKSVNQTHYVSKMHEYLQQEKNVDLIEFAEIPENQNQIKRKYIKETTLTDFYFIGIQEFFETDIKELKEMLEWPEIAVGYKNKNISAEYQESLQELLKNQSIIAQLAKLNQEDIEIYQEALSLREKRLKKSGLLYGDDQEQKQLELKKIQQLKLNPERSSLEITNIADNCEPLVSRGNIDKVIINDEGLNIHGWVASLDSGVVENLQVTVAGIKISNFEITRGLPSPDIKKICSHLDKAEAARFSLKIPIIPQQIQEYQDFLIVLIPLFQGSEGTILSKLFNPCLPTPSQELIQSIGDGNKGVFIRTALKFLGYFIQIANLKPTDKIFDLGCGVGRIAYALAYYLDSIASYEGFDISDKLVSWARQNITPARPNFNFTSLDIYHSIYNPTGKILPTDFRFPYSDESFDFVCVISLFTHLQAAEVKYYLNEIYRVLRRGGKCFLTCFLLNSESQHLMAKGKSSQNIIYQLEESFTTNPDLPEEAIGFEESLLLNWIEKQGFTLVNKTLGFWCGRRAFVCEDFLVIEKI